VEIGIILLVVLVMNQYIILVLFTVKLRVESPLPVHLEGAQHIMLRSVLAQVEQEEVDMGQMVQPEQRVGQEKLLSGGNKK
jgi:hypothetical protein